MRTLGSSHAVWPSLGAWAVASRNCISVGVSRLSRASNCDWLRLRLLRDLWSIIALLLCCVLELLEPIEELLLYDRSKHEANTGVEAQVGRVVGGSCPYMRCTVLSGRDRFLTVLGESGLSHRVSQRIRALLRSESLQPKRPQTVRFYVRRYLRLRAPGDPVYVKVDHPQVDHPLPLRFQEIGVLLQIAITQPLAHSLPDQILGLCFVLGVMDDPVYLKGPTFGAMALNPASYISP